MGEFSIDEATTIQLNGESYVHAWVNQCFPGHSSSSLALQARARQFSSFILIVGNITSANTFDPQHAILLQNKDELFIPLILEQIPAPVEGDDPIRSLSAEQQRFIKAFRAMQLANSLIGVCIIQIKPYPCAELTGWQPSEPVLSPWGKGVSRIMV